MFDEAFPSLNSTSMFFLHEQQELQLDYAGEFPEPLGNLQRSLFSPHATEIHLPRSQRRCLGIASNQYGLSIQTTLHGTIFVQRAYFTLKTDVAHKVDDRKIVLLASGSMSYF